MGNGKLELSVASARDPTGPRRDLVLARSWGRAPATLSSLEALMLAGHLGAGLVLKARFPSVPLGLVLVASVLPDLLWVFFVTLGWETLEHAPSHFLRPDTLGPMAFSHDVSMTLIYAGILGAIGMLASSFEWAFAIGLAVVSHVFLDWLVHRPDIGLVGPWMDYRIGLDLWRKTPLGSWGLEMGVVLLGAWSYTRARHPGPKGARRARLLVALLIGSHLLSLLVW